MEPTALATAPIDLTLIIITALGGMFTTITTVFTAYIAMQNKKQLGEADKARHIIAERVSAEIKSIPPTAFTPPDTHNEENKE